MKAQKEGHNPNLQEDSKVVAVTPPSRPKCFQGQQDRQ